MAKATEFDVTPEDIESTASEIEGLSEDFKTTHESIYQAVDNLKQAQAFVGDAGTEFNTRIEAYKPNFDAADKALENYIVFLRDYAQDMKNAEEDLKNIASSLGKSLGSH